MTDKEFFEGRGYDWFALDFKGPWGWVKHVGDGFDTIWITGPPWVMTYERDDQWPETNPVVWPNSHSVTKPTVRHVRSREAAMIAANALEDKHMPPPGWRQFEYLTEDREYA